MNRTFDNVDIRLKRIEKKLEYMKNYDMFLENVESFIDDEILDFLKRLQNDV